MRLKYFLLILILSACQKSFTQSYNGFIFRNGDLLFQDLDCGELCDAIEKVTHGAEGKNFSHIGLIYKRADSVFVIEAIGKDVHLTPVLDFINRNKDSAGNPKVVVGRLKPRYRHLNHQAVGFAFHQRTTPYDDAFLYNNGKYYCSEMIYDAYKFANKGKPFFQLFPMTFKDPSTAKTFPAWVKYYDELKMEVPEGKPGCNPGGISTSDKIVIVKSFY